MKNKSIEWMKVGSNDDFFEGRLSIEQTVLVTVGVDGEYGWIWHLQVQELAALLKKDRTLMKLVESMPMTGFSGDKEQAQSDAEDAWRAIWEVLGPRVGNG